MRRSRILRVRNRWRAREIPSPEQWREEVGDIVPWLRRLEARGGRVVFLRMPTSGELYQLAEQYYRRADYWDQLGAITGSPTVHFRDDERTANFECPDTSHLDYRDAREFTSGLLDVLVERGLLVDDRTMTGTPGR